jgi:hypothetical protein
MVTNYPHQIASARRMPAAAARPAVDGLGTRIVNRMRQFFCGLHGHDSLLQFEQDRMSLKCVSCGYESPGWALTEGPAEMRTATPPQRLSVRPELAGARRVA